MPKSILLIGSSEDRLERSDDGGIELAIDRLSETEAGDSTRHRIAVRSIRGHCVVSVGDGDDARDEWYCLLAQAVGISLTIDTLVVETHNGRDLRVLVDMPEDPLADGRVLLHLPSFLERKCTWFLE